MLEDAAKKYGDVPYIAMEDGREVVFFCYHTYQNTKEGMLKFVIVNPECRGKGGIRGKKYNGKCICL